ncbi:MAG: hypothetical protein S4CHLAM7_02860 [Chlamydiae bacterium]|nr:hypothetical protein [Chlamydiota bacterium]
MSSKLLMAHFQMTNQDKLKSKKGLFFLLWSLCILGSWSVLPYVQHLELVPSSVSLAKIFLLVTAQAMIFFGIVCWLSYLLVPKTDLRPFSTDKPFKRIVYPGVLAGFFVGLIIYLLDVTLFRSSVFSGAHPPAWTGLLASFYGGINEEVLLRLFLFTLVYFLFRKIFKFELHNRVIFLWSVNVLVAVVFGLGHLPAAFKLAAPSSFEIFRILLLNGIPGVVFGWLYWSRGLWTSMVAHFVTDVVIHVTLV